MQKKQKLKGMGLCLLGVGILGMPLISEANDLALILQTAKKIVVSTDNISPIHFADNGNDFGGFIYMSNYGEAVNENVGAEGKDSESYYVELNKEKYKCQLQVKGLYYDAQRGERLWPLDDGTKSVLNQSGLSLSGGLYTRCVKEDYYERMKVCDENKHDDSEIKKCKDEVRETYGDNYGYYGQIQHTYSGRDYNFIAGVNYQILGTNNRINIQSNPNLSPTFVRYDNTIPLGLIYDNNGGIGFVGCRIEDGTQGKQYTLNELVSKTAEGETIAKFFTKDGDDTLITTIAGANMDCSKASSTSPLIQLVIEGVVGMSIDTESAVENNMGSGKTQLFATSSVNNATLINYTKQKAETLCRGKWVSNCNTNNCTDNVVCIDNTNIANPIEASNHKGKTLIVKGGDVRVSPLESYRDNRKYDIFIDGGNLIINESNSGNIVIQRNGFMIGDEDGKYNKSITPENLSTSPNIGVASVLRGNFIVNGHITGNNNASLNNKYFIYGKLTSLDTYDNLMNNVFKWRCNADSSYGSDGYVCPSSVYQYAALSVIDQNYPSPLL